MELSARFWSDAELNDYIGAGIRDLWGAILDLHQEHYFTVDETNVYLAAGGTVLSGVPEDVFRVLGIEPRDTTSTGGQRGVIFVPKKYNSPEFRAARTQGQYDSGSSLIIYYDVSQAGAPVGAPTIHIAPAISGQLLLRFIYAPTLDDGNLEDNDLNPIPGESDNALVAYCIAWAHAKDRDDGSPDPAFIAIYSAEKTNILTRLTPRQEDEPDVVDDFLVW